MSNAILLTDYEAAPLVKMTSRRLSRLAKQGKAPCVILPDGEIRFREADLTAWVEQHLQPAKEGGADG
ncbi:MAG: hypothetical protein JXM70_20955 [Pirellulales bacterium]|nr:hypothetical protein [Pirellulales bacterium]